MLGIPEEAYLSCCITAQNCNPCADCHAHDGRLQKLRIDKKMWPCILSFIFLFFLLYFRNLLDYYNLG